MKLKPKLPAIHMKGFRPMTLGRLRNLLPKIQVCRETYIALANRPELIRQAKIRQAQLEQLATDGGYERNPETTK